MTEHKPAAVVVGSHQPSPLRGRKVIDPARPSRLQDA